MNIDFTIILSFIVYLCFMVAIGVYFYGKTTSTDDYFLAGRKLGSWVTSMSAQASDMSGWLLMGLPGAAYLSGLSASWIGVGLAIGTYLNWLFVAKPLRQYTKVASNSITIPQYFSNRFRDTSGLLSVISALFILVFFLFYTASGFVAAGKLFSSVFGISYSLSLAIGLIVVISYTFAGGFFAVCWTDFVQGILMFFAVLAVPSVAISSMGGMNDFLVKIENLNPHMLNIFVDSTGSPLTFISVISLLAWGIGYFGQPHILIRFMGINSPEAVKKSRRIATIWVVISLTAAVLIGMSGRVFLPETQELLQNSGETVYITMALTIFPTFIAGILLSAILAAIMSTADSQLLVTASAITEDFYRVKIRKNASKAELLWVSRIAVIVVALIAGVLAINPNNTVLGLVEYAWAGFGATFGPLVIFSLFWRRTTRNGALAGIIVGGLTTIIWTQLDDIYPSSIFSTLYEIVPGFILSAIAIIIVSLLDKEPSEEIYKEFDTYRACKD